MMTRIPEMAPTLPKPLRLLYVIPTLEVGGIEQLVLMLATRFDPEEFRVQVCGLTEDGAMTAKFRDAGVPCASMGKREGLEPALTWRIRRLARRVRPHIVHTHNQGSLLYSVLACMGPGRPILAHTEHTRLEEELPKAAGRHLAVNRILFRRVDLFIDIAHHLSRFSRDRFGIPEERLCVIPNGVDLERFGEGLEARRQAVRRSLGLEREEKAILVVAGLREQKDHMTLLRAMRAVVQVQERARLLVAGTGPTESRMREYMDQVGLARYVRLLGRRDDVPDLLAAADLFVLPSLFEGLPICLLEAMAAGLPVVATDIPGNDEVVVDGETGCLVPRGDADRMAAAIARVIGPGEFGRTFGAAGRERVKAMFDLDRMIRTYEESYRKVWATRTR